MTITNSIGGFTKSLLSFFSLERPLWFHDSMLSSSPSYHYYLALVDHSRTGCRRRSRLYLLYFCAPSPLVVTFSSFNDLIGELFILIIVGPHKLEFIVERRNVDGLCDM